MSHEISEMYLKGVSGVEISKKLNIPTWKVYSTLEKLGVNRRSNSINSRKYYVDDNFFENIDNQLKAYWFGYMLADGHVSPDAKVVSVSCKTPDKSHLKKFRSAVLSDYPIAEYCAETEYGTTNYARLKFVSEKMVSDLIQHGCVPRKSLILNKPNGIPESLYRHLLRGYVDGDGSITYHDKQGTPKLSMVGTQNFLQWTNENMPTPGKIYADKRRPHISYAQYVRKAATDNIEWMYKDAEIYMERKYQRAVEVLGGF